MRLYAKWIIIILVILSVFVTQSLYGNYQANLLINKMKVNSACSFYITVIYANSNETAGHAMFNLSPYQNQNIADLLKRITKTNKNPTGEPDYIVRTNFVPEHYHYYYYCKPGIIGKQGEWYIVPKEFRDWVNKYHPRTGYRLFINSNNSSYVEPNRLSGNKDVSVTHISNPKSVNDKYSSHAFVYKTH